MTEDEPSSVWPCLPPTRVVIATAIRPRTTLPAPPLGPALTTAAYLLCG